MTENDRVMLDLTRQAERFEKGNHGKDFQAYVRALIDADLTRKEIDNAN